MALTGSMLLESSALDLQKLLVEGTITSASLVETCLSQIAKYDRTGPCLRAVISTSPRQDLLRTAEALDNERARGYVKGPFHGIPIILKDLINVDPSTEMPTTLGSHAFKSAIPKVGSPIVRKLTEKGLIVIGKANLTELGNFKGNNLTSGWSALGGQTQSAYIKGGVPRREMRLGPTAPGGSSSGSAVAVSAGYCPLALGTEVDGSVCMPASRAALYAMKPSQGATDMLGIFTISEAFDVVGSMVKTVSDLAILVEYSLNNEALSRLPKDGFTSCLQKDWRGLRIGVVDPTRWRLSPRICPPDTEILQETKLAIESRIHRMRQAGAEVQYPIDLEQPSAPVDDMHLVLKHESRETIEAFLRNCVETEICSIEDLLNWNQDHANIELPEDYPNQAFLQTSVDARTSHAERDNAFERMRRIALEDTLSKKLCSDMELMSSWDQWIHRYPPFRLVQEGGPIATVPIGTLRKTGRPFGFAVIARPGDEHALFQMMSAYEATFPGRALPSALLA